jgi:ChrR Cupin-like domain
MDFQKIDIVTAYALETDLTEAELAAFEAELASSLELQAELAAFQAAAQAMAYDAPAIPMAQDLKQRLFLRTGSTRQGKQEDVPSPKLAKLLSWPLEDLEAAAEQLAQWVPLPGMETGFTGVFQVDQAYNQVAYFVRVTGAGAFPNHWHEEGETLYVVRGNFTDGDRTYTQGDLVYSTAQTSHQPTTTGCLVLAISSLDDRILESVGDTY